MANPDGGGICCVAELPEVYVRKLQVQRLIWLRLARDVLESCKTIVSGTMTSIKNQNLN